MSSHPRPHTQEKSSVPPHPPPLTDLRLGHTPVTEPLPLVAQGTRHSDSLGQSGSSRAEKGFVLCLVVEQREGVASAEGKQGPGKRAAVSARDQGPPNQVHLRHPVDLSQAIQKQEQVWSCNTDKL